MSTFKGTPGPWRLHREYSTVYVEGKARDPRLTQEVAAIGPKELGHEQQEADARLIASAPDLLEALQDLMPEFEARLGDFENAEWHDCWNKAVAAIAKAIGNQA